MTACDFLDRHPIPFFNTGIIRVVICLWYFVLATCTVAWLSMQSKTAQRGDASASRAVIFPVFQNIILILALSDVYFGIVLLTLDFDPQDQNPWWELLLYSMGFLLQHVVAEGIAIMLVQKGCGVFAQKKAMKLALVWGICTFVMVYVVYSNNGYSLYAFVLWNLCMVSLYSCLWLLPSHLMYRRPSVYIYAKIFLAYRLVIFFFSIFIIGVLHEDDAGRCVFFMVYLVLDAPVQFLGTYLALLEDSRWWQGIGGSGRYESRTDSKSPLHGFDVSLLSAQELAKTLDHIGGSASATLINFAHIYLDRKKLLGYGSFSKVYEGKYKLEPVAIKLIFTMDLTESDIQRVAAEATILSSINSKNIVKIYGVTVLPPSVCLVLELCAHGSLSDILRSSKALALSSQDRKFLALGCARGVAALHALNKHVVHRDIKSFNFLVDDQLNAKLADLELGIDDQDDDKSRQDNESLFQADFLFNWLAPEVLQSTVYTQASDVYSLSLVLWEIMSGEFPFVGSSANQMLSIKEQIIGGRRPDFNTPNGMPLCCSPYEKIVSSGWVTEPDRRPTAAAVVAALDGIWQAGGTSRLEVLQDSRKISSLLNSFLLIKATTQPRGKDRDRDSDDHGEALFSAISGTGTSAEDVIASYEQLAPLRDLYLAIANDPIWKIARSSPHPLIVISGQAPHIVMLMSTKFEALTGLRHKSCFGFGFEDFATSPKHVVDEEADNQKVLSDFYVSLKLNKCAHMILNFLSSNDEVVCMSIHAMPIFAKDSTGYNRMMSGDAPPSLDLEQLSASIRDMDRLDFSVDSINADKDALYYILDMSPLELVEKEEVMEQIPKRQYSTSSMASKLSGLFKTRPSTPSRHMSMQNQCHKSNRSNSFGGNRNSDVSNSMRTSYSSGHLGDLRDSFLMRESITSADFT